MTPLAGRAPARSGAPARLPHPWLTGAAYVAAFLLFDWVSYIRPLQGLNITPWNPQPALAVALLLLNRRWVWIVWLGLLAAEVVVRGVPDEWLPMLAGTAALALTYAVIAWLFVARMGPVPRLASLRDLLVFTAIAAGGALLNSLCYVAAFGLAGLGWGSGIAGAVARYWVGDAVGLLVVLPLLLALADAPQRAQLLATMRRRDWLLPAALVPLLLWVVFGPDGRDQFKFFYVLLLPVVWAAARCGLAGAIPMAVVTQLGLIVAMQAARNADVAVFELQVLMAALAVTGLLLGVTVDERERTAAELRDSLRLAAAGQMSAALAHELSQPLTALGSDAESVRLLAGAPGVPDAQRLRALADVARRMADDAQRAAAIVKRLREFFRTGSTELRASAPAPLLLDAVDAQRRRAEALRVELATAIDPALPPLLMDAVQIGVVVRNLVANAIDAAAQAGRDGRVSLRARIDGATLLVEVLDSGGGVGTQRLQTLFDPGVSDKAGGMGIGLSICRAIIEAHGGRLWAQPGPHGHFCFTLPAEQHAGSRDA